MMSSEFIIEVSEVDFQYEVLAYSNNLPVVVDFWADWCQPCHMLTPILEKLAQEANGAFRLAKVNADENPNLTMQFDIRSLPTVKAFNKGQIVGGFSGAQTEGAVREFVRKLAPSTNDLALEKGQSLLNLNEWERAADAFQSVLNSEPDDPAALLGLSKSLLAQGEYSRALAILSEFPASKEYSAAENLRALAEAMAETESEPQADDELGAIYRRAIQLVSRGNPPAAADGLLEVLRQDKTYRGGQARAAILGALEMMDPHTDETRRYRGELASTLF